MIVKNKDVVGIFKANVYMRFDFQGQMNKFHSIKVIYTTTLM